MTTGIYRQDVVGRQVEVPQEHIDAWCKLCQFPLELGGCHSTESIQACWNECGSIGGVWHIQHECPFLHIGQECQCNDYRTIKAAFEACGLPYRS